MTTVQTVRGTVPADALGLTLMHEHLVVDATPGVWNPPEQWKQPLRSTPVTPDIAWMLREDPFCCIDNCRLDDPEAAVEELATFISDGGRTVIDPTCDGMGRSPAALVELSRSTGLNIVMGAGWYLGHTHSPEVASASVTQLADQLAAEVRDGVDSSGVRPGILGEIGTSGEFTVPEERCLRAAARVQVSSGLPLMVHLDGWQRHGHRVLDVAESEGADPRSVVLCHMNPSGSDGDYQRSLARRGAWLEFDMIGMGFYYANQDGQSPSPAEDARAVAGLIADGYADQLLLSQDVFVKIMWTRNGGNGFSYVQRGFLPQLHRLGVAPEVTEGLLTDNPRFVFEAAARHLSTNDAADMEE